MLSRYGFDANGSPIDAMRSRILTPSTNGPTAQSLSIS